MAAVGPPPAIPPVGAPANPFTGNDIADQARPAGSATPLGFARNPGDGTVANPPIDLNQKLTDLRNALQAKYQQARTAGVYNEAINNNLRIIKQRIEKIASLITRLRDGLNRLRYELENQMGGTIDNILADINMLQDIQVQGIVDEIGAIQTALNGIQQQDEAGPDPFVPEMAAATWNDPAAQVAVRALPPAPAAGDPPGFIVGGRKSKKGGYTYPKMRSRSRLRNNKFIQHTFKTVKPKRHHKGRPKSKRTRKHRKPKN